MASTSVDRDAEDSSEDFESIIKEESDEGEEDAYQVEYLDDFKLFNDMELDDDEEVEGLMNVQSMSTPTPLSPAPFGHQQSTSMCDVVVTVEVKEEPGADPLDGDNDINVDEHVFHLADEHAVFKLARQEPQGTGRGRARGRPRGRGRGRGRKVSDSGARWVKGDRLIEVYVTDDDVPAELKEMRAKELNQKKRVEAHDKETTDADKSDEALFAGGEHSPHFEWSSMDTFECKRELFLPQKTGSVVKCENAYRAFRQYWDDDILSHIVLKTNQHAARLAGSATTFARDWYDTNIHEILVLFAFWMMLGIIRMPSTNSCFSMNPLLKTNIFRIMFSKARYDHLCSALQFVDYSNRPTDNKDPLFCFGPILEHLKARFSSVYVPSKEICIDESLTLWKGYLSFSQCFKVSAGSKNRQFGVKTYELCESSTGYLYSFFIYTGGATTYDPTFPSNLLKSTATILKLIHPLLDKGYTLFIDKWFNSPLLARFLKTRKTDCVGLVDDSSRNIPAIVSLSTLRDGEFIARHTGDVTVLTYQEGQKRVTTLSTFHGNAQGRVESTSQRIARYKPQVVIDYRKFKGGVDRKDQMLEPYELERKKCTKWYMKLFKRLLNCSILNSRILLQSATGASKEHLVFRLELVDHLLKQHLQHVPKQVVRKVTTDYKITPSITPNGNTHWPRRITTKMSSGRISRRRCVWCKQRNQIMRRTSYLCSDCDIPLCIEPCFMLFHSNS